MGARLITLTGPSTSGKSTMLRVLTGSRVKGFKPVILRKFTTRSQRADDGEEIECVPKIPPDCDLVYEQYGVRYGLRKDDIFEALKLGHSPIVIVNDIRTVEDLRALLGAGVVSLYIFRESPSMDNFLAAAEKRKVHDEDEYQRRFRKAQAIHRVYIENIQNFDFVILNVGDLALLERQVLAIVRRLSKYRMARLKEAFAK